MMLSFATGCEPWLIIVAERERCDSAEPYCQSHNNARLRYARARYVCNQSVNYLWAPPIRMLIDHCAVVVSYLWLQTCTALFGNMLHQVACAMEPPINGT